jgi:hypothetical protein
LPNYGLNSGAISLSAWFVSPNTSYFISDGFTKHVPNKTKHYTLGIRQGIGSHAFGGTAGPLDGVNKLVYSTEVSAGIVFRQYIHLYAGFTYRYYQHYYDYIINSNLLEFADNPQWNSSMGYMFLGVDFLMGHVGINIQGGLSLYRPFYRTFDTMFQQSEPLDYWLKYLFPTRMGVKYFLRKTQLQPKNNMYISAHICASFGEADFSEISVGYVQILK